MKITFLCPEINEGGGSRVVAIYARKLLEMGHDVTVAVRSILLRGFDRECSEKI